MIIELTYDIIKYIVLRLKSDSNIIRFYKLYPGMHLAFSDLGWNYWIYDTYEELYTNWTEYYIEEEFPPSGTFPPDELW